jgi:hypothetical protein
VVMAPYVAPPSTDLTSLMSTVPSSSGSKAHKIRSWPRWRQEGRISNEPAPAYTGVISSAYAEDARGGSGSMLSVRKATMTPDNADRIENLRPHGEGKMARLSCPRRTKRT